MKNQYLVIKLHGNWIEREQTKQRVKMSVEDIDVLNDENIITCHCTQAIAQESFICKKGFKDYVKRKIAVGIGEYLLEKGLIRFKESEEEYTIKIDGVITVISEEEKGGEEDGDGRN